MDTNGRRKGGADRCGTEGAPGEEDETMASSMGGPGR
jgi:hypothetical protein